jgi:hypothetical protein
MAAGRPREKSSGWQRRDIRVTPEAAVARTAGPAAEEAVVAVLVVGRAIKLAAADLGKGDRDG